MAGISNLANVDSRDHFSEREDAYPCRDEAAATRRSIHGPSSNGENRLFRRPGTSRNSPLRGLPIVEW